MGSRGPQLRLNVRIACTVLDQGGQHLGWVGPQCTSWVRTADPPRALTVSSLRGSQ